MRQSPTLRSPAPLLHRIRQASIFEQLGPGLITGAADDDPSGIATYSQAGAQFGFNMLWTMVLTYPLMSAVQLTSAHIGRVTGKGLASNLGKVLPRSAVTGLVGLLFIANAINIGADLAAMGECAELTLGSGGTVMTVGFALISLGLQLFIPYRRYATYLKWLTGVLLAYVAVVFAIKINWGDVARALVLPHFALNRESITMIVAIFGTTISPYMFFWQSAQEVEEVDRKPKAQALKRAPSQARGEFARMRLDTFVGMAVSNAIALAIMLSTAATLQGQGNGEIQSAAEAARALQPIAGDFAFVLFSLGIIGTGLLAVPVLAGSAAYAIGESQGWTCGLENKPWEAWGFYGAIGAATLIGLGISLMGFDAMKALFLSAVINGLVAVPTMAAMMWVASRSDCMGQFTAGRGLLVFGWIATAVMTVTAAAMIIFL